MDRSVRALPGKVGRRALRTGRQLTQNVGQSRALSRYLDGADVPKLNLGCGPNLLSGWFNTDLDPVKGAHFLDASRPFGVPPESFHYIYCEHMIEHVPFRVAQRTVRECFRALQPGGSIRVATPDLDVVCSLAGQSLPERAQRYTDWSVSTFVPDAPEPLPAFAINQVFRGWGHRFLYDLDALSLLLEDAGFENVHRVSFGTSDDSHLDGLEARGRQRRNLEHIEFETIVVEALRP